MFQGDMCPESKKYWEFEVKKLKKKIFFRGILGFPSGIAIGYVITILISLGWGQGSYYPCVPELTNLLGNEINAIILQAVLCGFLGAAFAAASVIWEMERWSIVRQTGIYFFIISVVMLPVAWFLYWMEHSIKGFLSYFGIFAAIFVFIWVTQYLIGRRNVRKMNERLK